MSQDLYASRRPGSLVVTDLATHPIQQFAVILDGQLLPIRFALADEAATHLSTLVHERNKQERLHHG